MKKRKNQIKTIEKIVKFNQDKKTNFLYLKHSLLEYIFQLDINSSSKLMLIYLIKNINVKFYHLYVICPYNQFVKDLGISKPTAVKSLKELNDKKIISVYSGKNKKRNTKVKEYFYDRKQFQLKTPYQHNIINLTIFYKTFFIYQEIQSKET
jgi:DNA-binding MarR family transcriptional regulator